MARTFLQPGFRFHATDVELVMYYLKRKVTGRPIPVDVIRELDLYKFAPWDLPDMSRMPTRDLEWYFYCPRDKKYANGMRANRATNIGYWKTTGKDRSVKYDSRIVGMKKTLVFHLGRAPRGDRTNWVMHEYRLQDRVLAEAGISQDSYVLCRVYEKSGVGPKNGEQYGAPFREEDWENDLPSTSELATVTDLGTLVVPTVDAPNTVMKNSGFIIGDVPGSSSEPIPGHNCSEKLPLLIEDGDIEPLSAGPNEEGMQHHVGKENSEGYCQKPAMSSIESTIESPADDADDIFFGLEDLSSSGEVKKADTFGFPNVGVNLPNVGVNYASGQMLLGDDGSYMELCDLDHPICLSVNSHASGHLSYKDVGTSLEPKLVSKCKRSNCLKDESNVEHAHLEEDRAYMELEDLISAATVPAKSNNSSAILSSDSNLKAVDEFCAFVSPGYECFTDQVLENDSSYVELNDLVSPPLCPKEANCSKLVLNDNLDDCYHYAGDVEMPANQSFLLDAGPPFHGGGYGNCGTSASGCEDSVPNPDSFLASVAGEETFISEDLVRGEQQIAYSRPQRLLDSIPARPASAAEHPSTNGVGKGSKGSSSLFGYYGGSSIHVKAEVTVGCSCTEEALSGKLGELSCQCYHERYIMGESRKAGAICGGGFTFVFILGIVTALFWVCIFAVAAKLGQYTLKLILS